MSAGRGSRLLEFDAAPTPSVARPASPGRLTHSTPVTPGFDSKPDDEGGHLGLSVWQSSSGYGAIRFADIDGYRVTAGLPRATSADLPDLHEEFAATCRSDTRKSLHFGISESAWEFLPALPCGASRARWHIGDLPVYDLAVWREDVTIPISIRTQVKRARNHGVTVSHWSVAPHDPARFYALRSARDAWLAAKPLPPLVFLTTPFLFEPWPQDGVFVAEVHGHIVGFLVGSCVLFGNVYRVDAVARIPGAPNGTAELLVREAFRDADKRGISRSTLGLAPLSGRSNLKTRGWLGVVTGCARRFGGSLYSFAGLEAFKAKFAPDVWVPLYAVAPGARFTPRDLLAVARVFAGGSILRYSGRALRWKVGTRSRP